MSEKVKAKRIKGYLVIMSKGEPIKIDEEELQGVVESINKGEIAVAKQGIVNPSYFVSIIDDKPRYQTWLEDTQYEKEKRALGLPPLKSIYGATPIGKLIEAKRKNLLGDGG